MLYSTFGFIIFKVGTTRTLRRSGHVLPLVSKLYKGVAWCKPGKNSSTKMGQPDRRTAICRMARWKILMSKRHYGRLLRDPKSLREKVAWSVLVVMRLALRSSVKGLFLSVHLQKCKLFLKLFEVLPF